MNLHHSVRNRMNSFGFRTIIVIIIVIVIQIGNGFLATVVGSDTLYAAGLFNGSAPLSRRWRRRC